MLNFEIDQYNLDTIINDAPEIRRFMPFNERAIEALSGPYLWFSHIEEFNDPFEAQFEYRFTRDANRIINAEEYSGLSGWPFEIAKQKLWDEFEADPEVFYQTRELKFRETYEQAASKAKFAYCCFFSERQGPLSQQQASLMWSHYGNGLRGMRITYNTSKLIDSLAKRVRATFIEYSETPRAIDLVSQFEHITGPKGPRWSAELFLESPSTKSKTWEYESEFRLVSETPGANFFDPKAITRIDLGIRMPDSQKKVVSMLVKQLNPSAAIHIAKVQPRSFDIHYVPL